MILESGSSLGTFLECPRKYYYKYIELLESPSYQKHLVFGSLFHAQIEDTHLEKDDVIRTVSRDKAYAEFAKKYPGFIANLASDLRRASELAATWKSYWYSLPQDNTFSGKNIQQISVEREWRFRVDERFPYHLAGKSDSYISHRLLGRNLLYEFKTAADRSRDDYIFELQSNAQINNNYKALHMDGLACSGVLYDIYWKPSLRQRKDESPEDLDNRIIDTVRADPSEYFTRLLIDRSGAKLDSHMVDLTHQFHALAIAKEKNYFYRNTKSCKANFGRCQFYEGCVDNNNDMFAGFVKKERKHSELSEEIQNVRDSATDSVPS